MTEGILEVRAMDRQSQTESHAVFWLVRVFPVPEQSKREASPITAPSPREVGRCSTDEGGARIVPA
jgi:hypothetical protein